jgi:hypothetical protein
MTFRNQKVAAVMASKTFMVATLTVTVASGIAGTIYPTTGYYAVGYYIVPFVVIVFGGLNVKSQYLSDWSYPGGRFIAPIAICLFVVAVFGRLALGCMPDIVYANGQEYFVAVNHGRVTHISAIVFYLLVASLPLAMAGLLLHLLLEHRWGYSRR